MLLRQSVPNIRIIHIFILIRLICKINPGYSCRIKEKVVSFSVLHTCVIQTFFITRSEKACISMVGFNTYVIKGLLLLNLEPFKP